MSALSAQRSSTACTLVTRETIAISDQIAATHAHVHGGAVAHPDANIMMNAIGLALFGRKGLEGRLRTAREALRRRQERMLTDRRCEYRGSRTYHLRMCMELRGHIAAAQRALAEWDATTAADVTAAEDHFLQAAE